MGKKKDRGKTAWLVTRHWVADYPKWEVAAILSSRLGGVRVREFVELIDLVNYYTLRDQLAVQWSGHGQTAYPAKFGQTKEGDPWEGEIFCGNDPYLRARRVSNLTVELDADGHEKAEWKERPRASISRPAEESQMNPPEVTD